MLFYSGVVDDKIAINDNAKIQGCFICNFDEGSIKTNSSILISIDSCFFEEDSSWENGCALNIDSADQTQISKVFATSCATKSSDIYQLRVGQFAFITGKKACIVESCISSCAPYAELTYNLRSVVEILYGNIFVQNINFSNNMGKTQVLFIQNDNDKESKIDHITYYKNILSDSNFVYIIYGKSRFISNHFISNQIEGEKVIALAHYQTSISFENCSFCGVEDFKFMTHESGSIDATSCYFQSSIGTIGPNINFIRNNPDIPQKLEHVLMRDVIKNVVKEGFQTRAKPKSLKCVVSFLSNFEMS